MCGVFLTLSESTADLHSSLYLICLFLCSLPFYLMELGIGQHLKTSVIETFYKIRPRWWPLGRPGSRGVYCSCLILQCSWLTLSTIWPEAARNPCRGMGRQSVLAERVVMPLIFRRGTIWALSGGPLAGCLVAIYVVIFCAVAFGKEILAPFTWISSVASDPHHCATNKGSFLGRSPGWH